MSDSEMLVAAEMKVAELRAECDALKRRLGQHDACNGVMGERGYVPECISLRAERDALRADAERWKGLFTEALDAFNSRRPTEIEWSAMRDMARAARAALKEKTNG